METFLRDILITGVLKGIYPLIDKPIHQWLLDIINYNLKIDQKKKKKNPISTIVHLLQKIISFNFKYQKLN